MNIKEKRIAFEKWYKENDGKYLNALLRYEEDLDFYLDNDYIQLRYKMFCIGIDEVANREGYKLVPIEPSKDMLNSGYRVKHDKIIDLGNVYKAMIGTTE